MSTKSHFFGHAGSDAMATRSGDVVNDSRLTAFLYLLIRDEVTPGRIELLLDQLGRDQGQKVYYSNGWLAQYAADVAERLKDKP